MGEKIGKVSKGITPSQFESLPKTTYNEALGANEYIFSWNFLDALFVEMNFNKQRSVASEGECVTGGRLDHYWNSEK